MKKPQIDKAQLEKAVISADGAVVKAGERIQKTLPGMGPLAHVVLISVALIALFALIRMPALLLVPIVLLSLCYGAKHLKEKKEAAPKEAEAEKPSEQAK